MSDLTNRIDDLLQKQGLRRADLCKNTGINEATVRGWINRGSSPQADALYKVAKYLGVTMEYLVTGLEQSGSMLSDVATKGLETAEQEWTPEQRAFQEQYMKLNEEQKELIRQMIKMLYSNR